MSEPCKMMSLTIVEKSVTSFVDFSVMVGGNHLYVLLKIINGTKI